MKTVIRHLRRAVLLDPRAGPGDGQLLAAFLGRHDETAFEALLRRHGPMVLGVCLRVLGNPDDADDAFQATFLVLVRKAATLRSRDLLGNWLYGVAFRTAMKARTMNAKRRTKEKQAWEGRHPEAGGEEVPAELLAQLDAELNRLPDKYRVPLVLCELEGKGRKEVAQLLGLPEGTLSWRLAQAKKLLAKRLSRHGVAVSGGALATLVSQGTSSAALSPSLLGSTAKAGMVVAAGHAVAAGVVPTQVLALAEGVLKTMLLTKLKVAVWVALLAVCAGSGVAYRAAAQAPYQVRAELVAKGAQPGGRPGQDDLEALRLEIEALRTEMRAMRQRMKALETEVRGQKDAEKVQRERALYLNERAELEKAARLQAGARAAREQRPEEATDAVARIEKARRDQVTASLISYAEGLLKKLRDNPSDQQANEALEQALKRLKDQRTPNKPPQ